MEFATNAEEPGYVSSVSSWGFMDMAEETMSTLNIRLPQDLKSHGLQVLDRAGISTSEAVRDLFRLLEQEQDVPDWMTSGTSDDVFEERRHLLRKVAGIAGSNPDLTVDELKYERTARYLDEGDPE